MWRSKSGVIKSFHQNTSETKHILLVVFLTKHRHKSLFCYNLQIILGRLCLLRSAPNFLHLYGIVRKIGQDTKITVARKDTTFTCYKGRRKQIVTTKCTSKLTKRNVSHFYVKCETTITVWNCFHLNSYFLLILKRVWVHQKHFIIMKPCWWRIQ